MLGVGYDIKIFLINKKDILKMVINLLIFINESKN